MEPHTGSELLTRSVLVLNRLWQAINVCSTMRAFSLLYQGEAHVVRAQDGKFDVFDFDAWKDHSTAHTDGEPFVRTVSFKMLLPRVVLLRGYDRLPVRQVEFSRRNIYRRDRQRCQYCGKRFESRELNLDHVVPLARGGKTSWENIVCSCTRCNTRKGHRGLRETGLRLVREPRRPQWYPLTMFRYLHKKDDSWRHFIDSRLWTREQESSS